MSFKKSTFIFSLAFASIAMALGLDHHFKNTGNISFTKADGYPQLWKKADSCESKGLTESALKVVEEIYARSKSENNAAQFVKAVIYKMKLAQYKEEFSQEKNISGLSSEIKTASFPAKPVLQSVLADAYWQYYQANRWKFYNRTQTIAFQQDDVSTYDLKTILNAVIFNYRASLQEEDNLKKTRIDVFEDIVIKGTGSARLWRPTLYDFLAHRALDFYKNSEAGLTKAANQFDINDENYLKPCNDFLKLKINKPQDSLSLDYYAISLFRDLLNFQLQASNEDGLADLEIERLSYIYPASKNPLKDSVYLQTLNSLAQRFEKNSRVAEIKHMEATWWLSKAAEYKPLENDRFKWNRKKALDICSEIERSSPGSRGAQMAKNTISSIQSKALSITSEEVNDVQLPNRVLVNYTNLTKLHFKIVKTDFFEYNKLLNKGYAKETISKMLSLPAAQSFTQALPGDADFNPHAVEVKIPALDFGYYILLASGSPDFLDEGAVSSYQLYTISDLAYINKRDPKGGYDFYVLNRQTGLAMKNVTAQVWHNEYNYKTAEYTYRKGKSFMSGENGYTDIEGNDPNVSNFYVEFISGKDRLMTGSGSFYNYGSFENNNPETRSFIFTDRAIYRPGQTVYFKSILLKSLKNKSEILTRQPVTMTFYDVNHQKISSMNLVTNDYGTVSGAFVAPQGVLTGQMQITDGYNSAYISVEEYKRPKFEALFDTLSGTYQLNDEVSVKGFARAYAGNMIDGAEVKYRVVRRINYPYWWYWYRPYYNPSASEVEIAGGFTKTDDKGAYEIKFKALPDPAAEKSENPVYTYEINADVTDVNGETRSAQTNFRAGYNMLELSFSCPEVINTKDLPKMSVSAVNLNGVEQSVSGQLTVYELKQPEKIFRKRLWEQPDQHLYSREEYYKLFPNDLYDDETNQYKWEKLKKAFVKNFNTKTDKNVVFNEFKNLSPGVYIIEGLCNDKSGKEVKSVNYLTVYNPEASELPVKNAQWSFDLKTIAEPGETAAFIVASSYKDINCLYELEGEQRQELKFVAPSLKPITIAVSENDRGGMSATTHFIKFGRIYNSSHFIQVPFTNKDLVIEYASFRNKLTPGQQEEWTLTVKNKKGDKAAAEMVAALYDASLDAFSPNNWNFNIYNTFYPRSQWAHSLEVSQVSLQYNHEQGHYVTVDALNYDRLNYFGMNYYTYGYNRKYRMVADSYGNRAEKKESEGVAAGMAMPAAAASIIDADTKTGAVIPRLKADDKLFDNIAKAAEPAPAPRKNFNETAFFFPHLETNEKGEVLIKFTIPESLTKWKFMGLAHTKDLSYGQTQNEAITQKELMVVPNAPRFFREGDKMAFVSKISNLSDKALTGNAGLKFYNAITEQEISSQLLEGSNNIKTFSIQKGLSASVEWNITIPEGVEAIKYRVTASAGNYSDGEEMVVPVLTNRMLVTESMPLSVRGNQTKEFSFVKFISQNNNSNTLKNHAYAIEFTANPAWYAIQSLPYLMEYPYECAEQTFARYYSNVLASHIVNSKPKIKQIFEAWKNKSPEAFLSNLEKNQELKSLLLEETPWVLEAKNESENKKRLAVLFDLNKMSNELQAAINKLEKMQTSNGGWPWFKGCPEDWYITQHIVTGFAHLQKLGVIDLEKDERLSAMVNRALAFCDRKLLEDFLSMKRYSKNYEKENHLRNLVIQYLYMRSYFKDAAAINKEAVAYYKKQEQKYWLENNRYLQAMIALSLNRYGDNKTATGILKSLKENAINSDEMGMYWSDRTPAGKEIYAGYYWYEAPVEKQAMMIEAFDEILNDTKSVDDLKTWLIKSKQTQNWATTRATTEAVYALLLRGSDWLATEPNIEISLGNIVLSPQNDPEIKTEAGTGYFKKTYSGSEINTTMGKVKVIKKDNSVSWGSVYWQYFEQLDKITPHETPLKLSKKLFVQSYTAGGPVITPVTESSLLKTGDKIIVRIELRADRDLEYIHLKDMRAAGFEPLNVFSGYRYQDGLSYYESTRDASSSFFISQLPKGTYVFEYPVIISHHGNFSNGISSVQCMYAPEFTSHSEGIRITVGGR